MNAGQTDAEVIVVGGGPAGSATALLLARAGHAVLLLDKASFPRHKACSEYINAGGVAALEELGLLDEVMAARAGTRSASPVTGSMRFCSTPRAMPESA
jgi:2-polyprenyl-6-methoxyphenol hydroxylase-like FAD-dependent oxidoreductase